MQEELSMQFHSVFFACLRLQQGLIILSRKVSPGWVVTCTLILSERTTVPPITPEWSVPASLITGADSPVIADSSIEAMPSIISPSVGIVSPASAINNISFI